VSATASVGGRPPPGLAERAGGARAWIATSPAAPVAVFALAAALRFAQLSQTAVNPFYDASVRSMGQSWHAFFTGAIDPSAQVAIDKPPIDLWLQVAATKVFGFTPFALLLPAAVGGVLTVVALYDVVKTIAGRGPALLAALALAVLPIAVITARGDTMDSVMAALVVGAFALAARGMRGADMRAIVGAGALVGLAFEVKLFEALIAAPALGLMWWLGAATTRGRRAAGLAAAGAALAVVALAWLTALTLLVPAASRPYAFGSTNGSAWSSTFVYDGWDRVVGAGHGRLPAVLRARRHESARQRAAIAKRRAFERSLRDAAPARPGPLRLLSSQTHLGARLGIELAAAWLALALLLARRRVLSMDRTHRAGLAAMAVWLAIGTVLFSVQPGLRPRYLEAFDPAVAGILGIALLGALRARPRLAALAVAAVLTPAAATSVAAVRAHVQDSGTPGAIAAPRLDALSAYLRAHRRGARYEAASLAVAKGAALIAHDGQPVLMLDGEHGRPLVSTARLAALVRHGQVRDALVGSDCSLAAIDPRTSCSPAARWIRRHGVDVSRRAGQGRARVLYALGSAR
jgi:4-amino-4-deoxy-L-arabinose transferase-like glycosyltransferase